MRTSRSGNSPCVLVTMGDPSGVGPETIVKSLHKNPKLIGRCLVIGDSSVLSRISKALGLKVKLNLIDLANVPRKNFSYGKRDPRYGRAALEYIDTALVMLARGGSRALVTAPVNKASRAASGVRFTGHTEFLADSAKTKRFAMMLMGGPLKVTDRK